ncbi:PAS domain S-box protein [Planctomyces sp. SH-PL14]|uniref:PAS domain-containing hybrid sensor histidine kinase/response regulator n=1 Tax=Planctomyces sp. SH-PL14 TaxID=1632864 RepID=UPI00078C1109|nr:PAS domain S-box protein [Planctomyces sp. SH-PL14]AMV20342.1 Autoinducer 2 sensor kinase/phosphatase LuxQ [Planctomyces sp. SH-PL14]
MEHFAAPSPLRDVEEHFSQLVASVQDYALFLLDEQGRIRTWNAGAERFKGYTRDEILGRHFSCFYPPELVASGWPDFELQQARALGRFEDEAWRLRKDGSRFWANVVITALYDENKNVRGFLKITRDLTERKAAEEALRLSEQRFRLLVERVKDYAIFMLDPEGRVVSWNEGAQRIKGYAATEIIGQHFSRFYSSEDLARGKPEWELAEAIARGSIEDEGWRVRKDGSLFWANVVITAIYGADNVLVGFAKVTRDLTEKRKTEALEVADRQKNEFLAMLAHELRNPLAPISNGLQLLKFAGLDRPTLEATSEMMERQLLHLIRLVDDLLDVSRIVTGKMRCQPEVVDLADVIERAVEETQPAVDAGGHELRLSLPGRRIFVAADVVRLSQVVGNLIGNAAKYSDQPSQIMLTVERDRETAVIRIQDHGIGIAAELLPRIFDIFTQADNSEARTRGGLGIGLSVVKKLVEMHGGTVTARSPGLGQGSEFTIRLPMVSEAGEAIRPAQKPAKRTGQPRRILVADDNVDSARTATALLSAWGHEVRTVFNGTEVLETARHFAPEIVLLDIGLPGMSGYEVVRRLRETPQGEGMVLVAVTGYGQESDRQRAFDAGFNFHLTKPADPEKLQSILVGGVV